MISRGRDRLRPHSAQQGLIGAQTPHPAMGLSFEVIEQPAALEALLPEWQALWERCPAALPFTAPAWLMPWWRQFAPGPLFTLAVRKEGRLVALAPGYVEDGALGRRILPLGISISDHLDILADADGEEALAGLASAALSRGRAWDSWELEELPPAALAHRIPLPSGYVEKQGEQQTCPVLLIPQEAGALSQVLPRRKRQQLQLALNRCRRRGKVELERVSGPEALGALEELIRLHALRWQERGEGGVLAGQAVQAFHRSAVPKLDDAGLLRMYILVLAGRVAAAYYGFVHRGCASFYLAGFDPAYAFESPGTVLIAHAISEAISEGCREFDFLRGPEGYKYGWGAVDRWNRSRSIQQLTEPSRDFL